MENCHFFPESGHFASMFIAHSNSQNRAISINAIAWVFQISRNLTAKFEVLHYIFLFRLSHHSLLEVVVRYQFRRIFVVNIVMRLSKVCVRWRGLQRVFVFCFFSFFFISFSSPKKSRAKWESKTMVYLKIEKQPRTFRKKKGFETHDDTAFTTPFFFEEMVFHLSSKRKTKFHFHVSIEEKKNFHLWKKDGFLKTFLSKWKKAFS